MKKYNVGEHELYRYFLVIGYCLLYKVKIQHYMSFYKQINSTDRCGENWSGELLHS